MPRLAEARVTNGRDDRAWQSCVTMVRDKMECSLAVPWRRVAPELRRSRSRGGNRGHSDTRADGSSPDHRQRRSRCVPDVRPTVSRATCRRPRSVVPTTLALRSDPRGRGGSSCEE
jgi:hypothetical protein